MRVVFIKHRDNKKKRKKSLMAPKRTSTQTQQQKSSLLSTRSTALEAASPPNPPSLSKAHALVVLSPCCQYRKLTTSASIASNAPTDSEGTSRVASRTQSEQLVSLMIFKCREGISRSEDEGKCTPRRYCYSLSRYGRSFVASQTFVPITVSIADEQSQSSPSTLLTEAFFADASNPFGGSRLPLLLLPETILRQYEANGLSITINGGAKVRVLNVFDSLRLFSTPQDVSGDAYVVLSSAAQQHSSSLSVQLIATHMESTSKARILIDMCQPVSALSVAKSVLECTGVQSTLVLQNAEATRLAPLSIPQLLAVEALAKAASSNKVASVEMDEPCHPLIARARMREELGRIIESQYSGVQPSPPQMAPSISENTITSTSKTSPQFSRSSISTGEIKSMIEECTPADVFGTSARAIIASVLARVLSCCLQSSRFEGLGLTLPKGVLLYDAPLAFGRYVPTGKTFLMGAMARTIEALRTMGDKVVSQQDRVGEGMNHLALLSQHLRTVMVDAHTCVTKEVGGTEKNIAKMLRDARVGGSTGSPLLATQQGTTIIFLDNLEVIAPPRMGSNGGSGNSVTDRSLSTLLTELDGVRSYGGRMDSNGMRVNNVILVATCRAFDAVDAAVRRPGRLDMHIELKPPQVDVCAAALASPLEPLWEGSKNKNIQENVTEASPAVLPSADPSIISPTHQAMLSTFGFANLWLRLTGGQYTIPESLADARFVARQVLFAVISRLTREYPYVTFDPNQQDALKTWVQQVAMTLKENELLDIVKEEVARAMKGLS